MKKKDKGAKAENGKKLIADFIAKTDQVHLQRMFDKFLGQTRFWREKQLKAKQLFGRYYTGNLRGIF